jgi:IS605 OrfB family transposase
VRLISKGADAYTLDRDRPRNFSLHGAVAYDTRILRYVQSSVSIWTVDGRERIPFVCGERQRRLLAGQRGESDLVYRDGRWYLFATCEVADAPPIETADVLGVDLGIKNIAADSDGRLWAGGHINGLRRRHARLRQRLQKKGTKAARRLLKMRRRRERRFATDTNHTISKALVREAEGTGRGIALEDLQGIRSRVTVQRSQRRTLHSWSFNQLRQFVAYKAPPAGVPVVYVDPRNTSRTCPACGHCDKRNRPTQARFQCVACSLAGLADTIAAKNIRVRGWAAVSRPDAGVSCQMGQSSTRKLPASAGGS